MQAEVAALHLDRVSPGAVRILARRGDTQVLIVHGEERAIDLAAGERLAWIDWYECEEDAQRISLRCSGYLCEASKPPDAYGWHTFSVAHLKTLVRAAQNLLNIRPIPAPDVAPAERQAWTAMRDAQLCVLIGRGWTAKAIAEHPLVRSTEAAVFKRAQRLGQSLAAVSSGQIVIRRLPANTLAAINRGAEQAQLTREAYASRLLIAAAADQLLLTAAI